MNRKGNRRDSARIDRFWAVCRASELKILYARMQGCGGGGFWLFGFIELFYIAKRRNAALDYETPIEYVAHALACGKSAAVLPVIRFPFFMDHCNQEKPVAKADRSERRRR